MNWLKSKLKEIVNFISLFNYIEYDYGKEFVRELVDKEGKNDW